ncbi:beta-N-acetylhexosaminidase [Heterostelium album PN500]|uniref:beta-N-acetylhexosaminidase n=1 Tax=Heterostelium pallidum (strain ATCC 26659 / Pp 5 / PN500) TaxID=670386 RepID=D3B4G1_HETP5|nr:beta-N-acetylhexosaminidase [Heterostelium album PN500]EFA84209.1 beta-N-acetylhexosaminidase [Heterostelium album PN500]|eukprot:XP_020436325.1 beta-N-acetylhexosaminidase [Heterostelium album PN500]
MDISTTINKINNNNICSSFRFSKDHKSNTIRTNGDTQFNVYPMPQSVKSGSDILYLSNSFKFSTDSNSTILLDAISRYTQFIFDEKSTNVLNGPIINSIQINVDSNDETLVMGTDESYQLDVEQSGIVIHAPTVFGALHALESFSQLVTYDPYQMIFKIHQCPISIVDRPRFIHRGLLLDTSRHFIPVTKILEVLDSLSYAKFNVFHWHIVDSQSFPMQSKAYPNLWKGAWSPHEVYTQDDILNVIHYAKTRGIRVIPEVDMPGHGYAWSIGYPSLLPANYNLSPNCSQKCPDICNVPLDISSPEVYNITQGLIDELTSNLFTDQLFHIGGDEVVYECWENSEQFSKWMRDNNFNSYEQALQYFEQIIHDKVLSTKRYPVVWEDTFLMFGDQLNKDVIVQIYHQLTTLQDAVKAGHRAIASNAWNWYLDILYTPWQKFYLNDITVNITDSEEIKRVLGGEVALWSEMMDSSDIFSKIWPKAAAAAERLWSDASVDDVDEVVPRLERFRCHMIYRGIESAPLNSTSPNGPGPYEFKQSNHFVNDAKQSKYIKINSNISEKQQDSQPVTDEQQFLLRSIESYPTINTFYNNLALTISNGESVTLLNGQSMTQQQLYLKAIDCDPTNYISYNNLAKSLRRKESITLLNGQSMTQQQLYMKAIDCDPTNYISYYYLALLLKKDYTVESNGESITLNNGQSMTKHQLFLKTIECDPSHSNAFFQLGCILHTCVSKGESITLNNGQSMTLQQLYLKAIECDPTNYLAYYNLSFTLPPRSSKSIKLYNGKSMTSFDLLLKVIDLNPNYSNAYLQVANRLSIVVEILLKNGRLIDLFGLYKMAIMCDPSNYCAYANLANIMENKESITLQTNGTEVTFTKKDLYIKAIQIDPNRYYAYFRLALNMKSKETITLNNGTLMTKQQLLLDANRLDNTIKLIYKHIGLTLKEQQTNYYTFKW